MPEVSNSFQAGKMNKDADERLVTPGEYRNALNIQVATSEGSHVGTAQSVLGNRRVTNLGHDDRGLNASYPGSLNLHTVGSIVNEKNDRIYRLVAQPNGTNGDVGIDRILEYKSNVESETCVFTDVYKVKCGTSSAGLGITTLVLTGLWADSLPRVCLLYTSDAADE